jgi:hypothetical protein
MKDELVPIHIIHRVTNQNKLHVIALVIEKSSGLNLNLA